MKIDLSGKKIGNLYVLGISDKVNKYGGKYWNCLCICGKEKEVLTGHLNSGSVKSCGCKPNFLRHSDGKSEYRAWSGMKKRCFNKNNEDYKNYGGRGIKVCKRWINSYENFYEDMGEKPSSEYTLERIDVNKDYCPENCKWANRLEQVLNRRKCSNNTSGVTGVSWKSDRNKWHAFVGVNYKKINLGYYDDFDDAKKARKEGEIKYLGKEVN